MKETLGINRNEIDTPALLIDLDIMERNIARMADYFKGVEANLRPHTKTHKTPALAHKQIEAGAKGITCAKLGEAEVMADRGIRDILIANQIVGSQKIARLMDLAKRSDVIVAVDNLGNAEDLSAAARKEGLKLGVLVEVNVGMNRCGVESGEPALELAKRIVGLEGLKLRGMMGYEGHIVDDWEYGPREVECKKSMKLLMDTVDMVRSSGIPVEIVSAGGTGTHNITGEYPGITEVQAGSYIFMDTNYRGVEGVGENFDCALTILATVISRPSKNIAIVDAGLKTVTKDFGFPEVKGIDGVEFLHLSEEHGKIGVRSEDVKLEVGDKTELIISHCCTTVNLHDRFYGIRDGKLEVIWDIEARGRAR